MKNQTIETKYAIVDGKPVEQSTVFVEAEEGDARARLVDGKMRVWVAKAWTIDVMPDMSKHVKKDGTTEIPESEDGWWDASSHKASEKLERYLTAEDYESELAAFNKKADEEMKALVGKALDEKKARNEAAAGQAKEAYDASIKAGLPEIVAVGLARTYSSAFDPKSNNGNGKGK